LRLCLAGINGANLKYGIVKFTLITYTFVVVVVISSTETEGFNWTGTPNFFV
jgi:hypothetical protein